MRIIHLSDLHLRKFGVREKFALRLIHRSNPDLIVVTGDIIPNRKNIHKKAILEFFQHFGSKRPVYVVKGNAEFTKPDACDPLSFLKSIPNVEILSNKVISIQHHGQTVNFIGLDPYVDNTKNFTTRKSRNGLYISGGGSWVDCFYNVKCLNKEMKHYFIEGCIKVASEQDLAGVLVCNQIPSGKDRFYRLTFGGHYPIRFSSHGTNINLGDRFATQILQPNVWYKYKIEVNVCPNQTLLKAKVWSSEDNEPEEPILQCGDSTKTKLINGTLGFWSSRGGSVREYTLGKIYDLTEKRTILLDNSESGQLFEEHFVDEAPWSDLARLGTARKLAQLMKQVSSQGINILLCHDPAIAPFLQDYFLKVVLSGHTHGGQIAIPFLQKYFFGYSMGQLQKQVNSAKSEQTLFVINKGLGTSALPIRFGVRCEMVLIEI